MKLYAHLTTSTSMPEADPGIMVQEWHTVADEGVLEPVTDLECTTEPRGWGEDAAGNLDEDVADAALLDLGYRRVTQWDADGVQYIAEIERFDA